MSNFNGDLLDDGLQGVMGKDRCRNVYDGDVAIPKKEKTTRVDKVRDAQYEPVRPDPNQFDKLKACGKDALLYGSLSLLFFYFQQTGQMLPSAAMPCICVCCILLGLGVGKHAR